MRRLLSTLACILVLFSPSGKAGTVCYHFTQEHVDLLSVQWNAASNSISLVASDDTHGMLYASNQCVVICPETMRFTLPAGTPLGNEGAALWILPQNPYEGVPYVGVSSEQIPAGVFDDPLTIQLSRVEGPGQFILWQAGSFGSFDVKMDSRDGISAVDALTIPVGGHSHFNWGFTTNGLHRLYFQVSGRKSGHATNIISSEIPFTFHIEPLRPFEIWTATNWPCECAASIVSPGADPDGDEVVNVLEYAFGNDPNISSVTNLPALAFVSLGGTNYGALRYNQATNATDLTYEVRAGNVLGEPGILLTNTTSTITSGPINEVTVRDVAPMKNATNRFYQLHVNLHEP